MSKKHVYYFDYIRLISALGVIYMHVAAGPLRGPLTVGWHAMNVLTCFAFTAVPLFIMMSGYLLLNSEKTADTGFLIKKRLPRLVLPLITWTVVAVLWRLVFIEGFSLKGFYDGMVGSIQSPAWVHFWYMYTLIALYIISPVLYGGLKNLDKKGHVLVFVLACLPTLKTILSILLPSFLKPFVYVNVLDQLTLMSGTVAMFVLGYYLGNLQKKIPNAVLIATAILVLAVIIFGTYKYTVMNGQFDQTFQNQFAGFEIVLAACVFLLFKQNFNKECKLFRLIPVLPLSLSIYLMHNILLATMQMKILIDTFRETVYVTLLNFIICFLVMKTVATIKPLCYIFTGIPYKNACETCNWIFTYRNIKTFISKKRNNKK